MNGAFLTGRDTVPLVARADGTRLLPSVSAAFDCLAQDARTAGFDLCIASAHRDFARQLAIFNGKARGERAVTDDHGEVIDLAGLAVEEQLAAILRFSALPGGSRHHWGTEVDVYDGAATPADYRVTLSPAEVCPGGIFDPLHCWLDVRIARGESYGFFRPYDRDRGGVAPERWHLSYAPLAEDFSRQVDAALLASCWASPEAADLALRDALLAQLPALVERYLQRVAAAPPGFTLAQG